MGQWLDIYLREVTVISVLFPRKVQFFLNETPHGGLQYNKHMVNVVYEIHF